SGRNLVFIMLTADGAQTTAIEAVRAHVFDFLRKPVGTAEIFKTVRAAAEHLIKLNQKDAETKDVRERLDATEDMQRRGEALLQKLIQGSELSLSLGRSESRLQSFRETLQHECGKDATPLECTPIDIATLIGRIMPAIDRMAADKGVQAKTQVSHH